jgi:hypothetical protein
MPVRRWQADSPINRHDRQRKITGAAGSRREPQGAAGSRREPQGAAGSRREPQGAAGSRREPQGAVGSRREPQGAAGSRREPQGAAGSRREPQASKNHAKLIALPTRRTSREQTRENFFRSGPTGRGTNRLYGQKNGLSVDAQQCCAWKAPGAIKSRSGIGRFLPQNCHNCDILLRDIKLQHAP